MQLPKIPQKTFNQLVAFLLNCEPDSELVPLVGYTWDETLWSQYKLVIYPSKFFTDKHYGLPRSMPAQPFKYLGNTPVFHGEPDVVRINGTLVVYLDIIAASYFLLSRYEELVVPDNRDEHGRFQGKRSITDGVIYRPIVDEYGKLLRGWLRECGVEVSEPPEKIKKIYLTHDIDVPYLYRSFRQLGATFLKQKNEFLPALKTFLGKLQNDPFYTYPFILEQNEALRSVCGGGIVGQARNDINIPVETIFFIKAGKYPKEQFDKPYYNLHSKDIQRIISQIKQSGAKIGLHTSYTAGDMALLSVYENELLQKAVGEVVTYNRYHYLRAKNLEDMQCLPLAGISDDFTVGYADMAGFRLGTCRPVNWIDLKKKQFSDNLTLHPLTVMDCTLSSEKYMNLSYEWAFNYATELVDQVKKHNGELVLLWHNSIFAENTAFDHKRFYTELLNYIKENQ